MPELPEVEWGRKLTARAALGRRILRAQVPADRIVYAGQPAAKIRAALIGAKVQAVRRKGKYIWLELDRGPSLVLHLGMTGAFHSKEDRFVPLETGGKDPVELWPPRFVKLHLFFEGGTELVMVDARRLGRIRLVSAPLEEEPLSKLGPDIFDEPLNPREFARRSKGRRGTVKALLLDQSFIAGVGNWIADEVLYQAGIDPRRAVDGLTDAERRKLVSVIRRVVTKAVAVDADKARFPKSWLFHRRWGRAEGARTAKGEPIEFIEVGGRTTAFVPERQR